MKKELVFVSNRKKIFSLNIEYEKGESPIMKFRDFFKELDEQIVNIPELQELVTKYKFTINGVES